MNLFINFKKPCQYFLTKGHVKILLLNIQRATHVNKLPLLNMPYHPYWVSGKVWPPSTIMDCLVI